MRESLVQTGLTVAQADAYLLLLDKSPLAPPAVATELDLTRTNAYKVLEQLAELGLATRTKKRKKFVYSAGDPRALNDILAQERNKVIALEKAVHTSLQTLRAKYQQQTAAVEAKTYHGSAKLKQLYEQQAETKEPIYFVKSRADIPTLGYETMNYVRQLPVTHGTQRFGITPDSPEAPTNPAIDKHANLTRTWIDEAAYTAPVEWSVSGDEVTIFIFEKDGSAIRIRNQAVADSFRELWQLLDACLRRDPEYKTLPRKAQRTI